jgi:hypothetical protein
VADGGCTHVGIHFLYQPVFQEHMNNLLENELHPAEDNNYEIYSQGDQQIEVVRSIMCRESQINDDHTLWGSLFLGPVFYGMTSWLVNGFNDKGINDIAFISRTGTLLHHLYLQYGGNAKTYDLHITKYTVLQASIFDCSFNELFNFFVKPVPILLSRLLQSIGLDLNDINYTKDVLLESVVPLIHTITGNATLRKKVIDFSIECRSKLLTHIGRTFGGNIPSVFGIVDIGYNGTIQLQLSKIFQHEHIKTQIVAYYLGLTAEITELAPPHQAFGFLMQNGQPSTFENYYIPAQAVIEQSLLGPIGSVIGYHDNGDPILGEYNIDVRQQGEADKVRTGIKYFMEGNIKSKTPNYEVYSEYCRKIITRLLIRPSEQEVKLFSHWYYEINNGCDTRLELMGYTGPTEAITHYSPNQLCRIPERHTPWLYGWLRRIDHKALTLVQILTLIEDTGFTNSVTQDINVHITGCDETYQDTINLNLGNKGSYRLHTYNGIGSWMVTFEQEITIDSVLLCTQDTLTPFDKWYAGSDHIVFDARDIPTNSPVYINFTLTNV